MKNQFSTIDIDFWYRYLSPKSKKITVNTIDGFLI